MTVQLGTIDITIIAVLFTTLQFLLTLWISERFKASLQKENATFLENLRWDMKIREQASKVAEYLAISHGLTESSPQDDYRKANQLAWELMMWLPADVYKSMGQAITSATYANTAPVLLAVRKILLKDAAGNLSEQDFILHRPGLGRKQN
jgi:hypothetical protein